MACGYKLPLFTLCFKYEFMSTFTQIQKSSSFTEQKTHPSNSAPVGVRTHDHPHSIASTWLIHLVGGALCVGAVVTSYKSAAFERAEDGRGRCLQHGSAL